MAWEAPGKQVGGQMEVGRLGWYSSLSELVGVYGLCWG